MPYRQCLRRQVGMTEKLRAGMVDATSYIELEQVWARCADIVKQNESMLAKHSSEFLSYFSHDLVLQL